MANALAKEFKSLLAAVTLAWSGLFIKFGTTTALRMPIITITTRISIRLNPSCFFAVRLISQLPVKVIISIDLCSLWALGLPLQ